MLYLLEVEVVVVVGDVSEVIMVTNGKRSAQPRTEHLLL